MKIKDVVIEDVAQASTNDFQKMMTFVKANNIQGLPPDQQIALALFRELERQKQRNDELDAELSAAEQRIDVATRSGEMQKQALGQQQAELEKERGAIEKLDVAHSEREQASEQQLEKLTQKLEAVKRKPGVDPAVAQRLEQQISELRKNGISADKVADLEKSITNVQQKTQVDTDTMNDLIDKVNAAQATAQELEKTKQSIGQDIEKTMAATQAQIAQLRQQLSQMQEIEKGLLSGDFEHDEAIGTLEKRIEELSAAVAARQAAAQGAAAKMIAPQARPQQIAQKFVQSGDLQTVAEHSMARAIRWATGK